MKKNWIVVRADSSSRRFSDDFSARKEADYLASLSPGTTYIVYESVAHVAAVKTEWSQHEVES